MLQYHLSIDQHEFCPTQYNCAYAIYFFFFSSRRRHTRFKCDWSSDVCSSDLRNCTVSAEQCTSDTISGCFVRCVLRRIRMMRQETSAARCERTAIAEWKLV